MAVINNPIYYHREYKNDIDVNPDKAKDRAGSKSVDQIKRVALVALPFISLYKPIGRSLSLVMDSARTMSSLIQLKDGIEKGTASKLGVACVQTTIAVAALCGTVLAHPIGMVITTSHDLIINAMHVYQAIGDGDSKLILENIINIANNSFYLGMVITGLLELVIISFSAQILYGLYHSIEEFNKGNNLEACGHLLMSAIRINQLRPQIELLMIRAELKRLVLTQSSDENSASETSTTSSFINAAQKTQSSDQSSSNSIVQAYRVEYKTYKGCEAHIAYYSDNIIIVTIAKDPSRTFVEGGQYIIQNNIILALSFSWTTELVNGIQYIKHIYPDGCVYSNKNSQYIVFYYKATRTSLFSKKDTSKVTQLLEELKTTQIKEEIKTRRLRKSGNEVIFDEKKKLVATLLPH